MRQSKRTLAQDAVTRRLGGISRKTNTQIAPSPETSYGSILHLQQLIGNQAVQRLLATTSMPLIQRQVAEIALSPEISYGSILHLQQLIGNQAVQRLLAATSMPPIQRQAAGEETPEPVSDEAAQCRKVDASGATVQWNKQRKENLITGSLRGGGKCEPHKTSEGDFKYPDVTIDYDAAKKVWRIRSIEVYCRIVVNLPNPGAYPKMEVNVLNQPDLKIRTPETPEGKGHWENVAENLDLYRYNPDLERIKWWVENSTEYHEMRHYELYKDWFNGKWSEMRNLLENRLRQELENNKILPISKENLKKAAHFILRDIIIENEQNNVDNDEIVVYRDTREKYWQPKRREIIDFAKKKGWDRKTVEK
jgi:hypothetical protein